MSGVISSRVSNLKFMQRAIQKNEQKTQAEAIDKRIPEAHNEEHWIAPRRGREKGCVVLLEGDPPATSGRMSFQGFTTDSKAASRIEASEQGEVAEVQEGVSVCNEVMAEKLGKTKKKKKNSNSKEPEHFHRGVKKFKSKK
ncbi:hypothetical protein Ndes2437B_g08517 [Nannochloris sp. 'desiccata']